MTVKIKHKLHKTSHNMITTKPDRDATHVPPIVTISELEATLAMAGELGVVTEGHESFVQEIIDVASSGRSDGLACCWDNSVFLKNQVYSSPNYITVSGAWVGLNYEASWRSSTVRGAADFILARKLKSLKEDIRRWHNQKTLEESSITTEYENRVMLLESKAENVSLDPLEIEQCKNAKRFLLDLHNKKRLDLRQKAKLKWMVDGDENSTFFHGIINANKKRNRIHGITINVRWESDPIMVKREVFSIFKNKFAENLPIRPSLKNPNLRKLSSNETASLEEDFSDEEIKSAILSCGSNKAPGPDGFSFNFIRK
ncbi:hypothetical protein QVD17_31438 [Tagetes erecta]|uniref:RNA-directed DNA polymerase, eukaryota, reverse transcriptase zinc-binding domain protein n=1 Tax=Tagetes erecta TaxID=13708 RepID=A0AAD8NPB6_TARER|nr:hypothetical protein QVD17_31438 [Tagetes erecta]